MPATLAEFDADLATLLAPAAPTAPLTAAVDRAEVEAFDAEVLARIANDEVVA